MFRIILVLVCSVILSQGVSAGKGGRWASEPKETSGKGFRPAKHKKVEEPSADEPPADELPAEEPPAEEPPADEPPAEEPPAEEPPAEEPPAEEPNLPPELSLLSPTQGESFAEGSAIHASVSAVDMESAVAACDFSLGGLYMGRDTTAPYQFNLTANGALAAGSYELQVSCADTEGLSTTGSVSFVVVPPAAPASFDVALNWWAPTTRADGSVLPAADIASYEIYFYPAGDASSGSSTTVDAWGVDGEFISDYTLEGLPTGEYHFVIATVDTTGKVSEFSDTVVLSLP